MTCNRIDLRMECCECGYPYSEALFPTDYSMPHRVDGVVVEPREDDPHPDSPMFAPLRKVF